MKFPFTRQIDDGRVNSAVLVKRREKDFGFSVLTKDQEETDRLWSALVADGGQESRCGWLTDRWGLSWQIVPEVLPRLLGASDRAAAGRAQEAMLQMNKIDIARLEAAFNTE